MDINEINLELPEHFQRYVNECCESESDGKTDGFVLVVANAGGGGHRCFVVSIIRAPDHGGVPWASCIFASYSFLLGFDFFTCFWVC
jgi:hypothetical protein